MATPEQIAELREMISEPDETWFSDEVLSGRILTADNDLNMAAAATWRIKASVYAELVDISEAGSSRKNSQLYKNALEMAKSYEERSDETTGQAPAASPTTRPIVRA